MTTIMAAVTPTWMISSTRRQSCKKAFTLSIFRAALLTPLGRLGDSQKFVGLQARPADQAAVDVPRRQKLSRVACLHRAAIEQPHPGRIGHQPTQHLANV